MSIVSYPRPGAGHVRTFTHVAGRVITQNGLRGAVGSGTLTLHIDTKVGEGRIRTRPGKVSIAGEGLNVGKEGGEQVTDDYPGQSPWAFVGGTIQRAVIDVTGEPFVDLANEARMALARE